MKNERNEPLMPVLPIRDTVSTLARLSPREWHLLTLSPPLSPVDPGNVAAVALFSLDRHLSRPSSVVEALQRIGEVSLRASRCALFRRGFGLDTVERALGRPETVFLRLSRDYAAWMTEGSSRIRVEQMCVEAVAVCVHIASQGEDPSIFLGVQRQSVAKNPSKKQMLAVDVMCTWLMVLESVHVGSEIEKDLKKDVIAGLLRDTRVVLRAAAALCSSPRPLLAFALLQVDGLIESVCACERPGMQRALALDAWRRLDVVVSDREENKPDVVVQTIQQSLDRVVDPMQPLDTDELQEAAVEQSLHELLNVCFALGRLPAKARIDALQRIPAARLLDVAVAQFRGTDGRVAGIATRLATEAMEATQTADVGGMVGPLAELLSTSITAGGPDSVAHAAAGLLARAVCHVGSASVLRQAVEPLLSDDNTGRRQNALLFLEHMLERSTDKALMEELTRMLLTRLDDSNVQLRGFAARLFAHLDSDFILPELVQRALDQDVKVRAAGERALLEHMQRISASALPRALALVLGEVDRHAVESAKDVAGRVLRTLPRWVESLSRDQAMAVLTQCVAVASEDCRSPTGAKVLGGVAGALPMELSTALAETVLQPLLTTQETTDVFERVAPLILLRALPLRSLIPCAGLAAPLIERMDNETEFDAVRKLAAELVGRLEPHIAFGLSLDGAAAKLHLYAYLTALTVADGHMDDPFPAQEVLHTLIAVFRRRAGEQHVEELQRGSMDCVAALIHGTLKGERRAKWIVDDDAQDVLSEVLRVLSDDASMQVRICVANVLVLLGQQCHAARHSRCVPAIVTTTLSVLAKDEALLVPALIQILFSWMYAAPEAMIAFRREVVAVALTGLRKAEPETRLASLKLIAGCLAKSETDDDTTTAAYTAITALTRKETDAGVITLATRILSSF